MEQKEEFTKEDNVFLRFQVIENEHYKVDRVIGFKPEETKKAVYFPMTFLNKGSNERYGIAYVAYIPKDEEKNKHFIASKQIDELKDGFIFFTLRNFEDFLEPEKIFASFYPTYYPKTGIYSLYAENGFMMASLLLFIENYKEFITIIQVDKPVEIAAEPAFVSFYRDYLEAFEGEEYEGQEDEAREIWETMSDDEKAIYRPQDVNIFNLSSDQTADKYIKEVKVYDQKEEAIKNSYKVSYGQYLCNSDLDKAILEELTREGKIVDSTNHFSVLATDNKELQTSPDARLKVTTNKINWTRQADGDPLDVFVHKPIAAKYDLKEAEKISRTIEVYFINKEQRDQENAVFRQIDNETSIEFTYHQVQIST